LIVPRRLVALPPLVWATLLAGQAKPAAPPDAATRRAMALAYLRVEMANRDRPIAANRLGPLNQAFDRSTLRFFGGDYPAVLASLDSVAGAIEVDTSIASAHRAEAIHALDHPGGDRRVVTMPDGATVPYRLYRPANVAKNAPVIVAFHGAGADETAFLEAYGAGQLRRLADRRGFVIVSPLSNAVAGRPERFDLVIADAATAFPFDRSRVYLLGHSLGGMVAWRLAQERPSVIRAVVCLAGAGTVTATPDASASLPPTLVFGGSLDIVVPPARLKPAVDAAKAIGWNVEYRELADQGHTLMVGMTLEQAVTWLLSHPSR
jgi:predicted esterase